jgi:hypothetical protein
MKLEPRSSKTVYIYVGQEDARVDGVSIAASSCAAFPDKIAKCESFTCSYTHPLTNNESIRTITGIVDNRCEYIDRTKGAGVMDCKYPQELLGEISENFSLILSSTGSDRKTSIVNDEDGNIVTKKYIKGVEYKDPLNDYGDACQFRDELQSESNCDNLPEKLKTCEQFSCQVTSPLATKTHTVEGMQDGRCVYSEEIPNFLDVQCNLTRDYQDAIAQYYSNELLRYNDPNSDQLKETFTIKGKEVRNPLESSLVDGDCLLAQ